jgi:hypothetical protein
MADKRISQLNQHTTPSGSDLLVIVNNNETKKITYTDLIDGIASDNTAINNFTASYLIDSASFDNRIDTLENWSSSLTNTFATDLEVSIVSSSVAATIAVVSSAVGLVTTSSFNSYTASQSTSSLVSRLNAIENVSASWITESETGSFLTSLSGAISSSSQLTSSYDTRYTLSGSVPNIPTGSFATTGSNTFIGEQIISSSLIVTNEIKGIGNIFLQPDVNDARYFQIYNTAAPSGNDIHFKGNTDFNYFGDDINYLKIDDSAQTVSIVGVNGVFVGSSLNVTGAVSASAGFTGSIIGEINATNGVISGSSQLTSSYDTRYTLSGSVQPLPSNLISSSAQITAFGFVSSSTTINTGSFATTGSNSFNGNQSITGSLVVSAVAVVAGAVTIPSASVISLTSGSSISVDASGAITGSLTGSVFGIGDVVAFSSSLNSRIINGSSVAGTISGSSQLTSSFDTRYLNTGGDGVISGSSQLTSSFDTRYAISASFVSSSNLSSIQTITSASYAALTPVSGTLYIIIG